MAGRKKVEGRKEGRGGGVKEVEGTWFLNVYRNRCIAPTTPKI
jgi:hypothetical protein